MDENQNNNPIDGVGQQNPNPITPVSQPEATEVNAIPQPPVVPTPAEAIENPSMPVAENGVLPQSTTPGPLPANQPSVTTGFSDNMPENMPSQESNPYDSMSTNQPASPTNNEPVDNMYATAMMPEKPKTIFDNFNWKKFVLWPAIILLGLSILGVGAYLGYLYYIKSSDARILNKVSQNILNAKNLKADFRIGTSGVSVKGELLVDKDQDIKGSLKNDLIPLEMIYIREKDTAYMPEFSLASSKDSDSNEFTEYKNMYSAIEKYGLKEIGLDSLDPNKNYFNAENVKFFKRVGEEKIDGKSLYKYSFEPDEKAKEEGLKKANDTLKKINTSSYYIEEPNLKTFESKVFIWVGTNDFKVHKVEGETGGTYDYQVGSYKCLYEEDDDLCIDTEKNTEEGKFDFEWVLEFDYDYNEDIELPEGAKITNTIDLANVEAESAKTKIKADGRVIQAAVESYYYDNNRYPANLEAINSTKYLFNHKDIDFSNFDYQTAEKGYTLIIKYNGEKIDEIKR